MHAGRRKRNRFSVAFLVNSIYLTLQLVSTYDMQHFDDTILFKINWPGRPNGDLLPDTSKKLETYTITSADNEKYQCTIPDISEPENLAGEEYTGPTGFEILMGLFGQNTCSYRLEAYWTYELCHGKYIRQYHEERDGKKVNVQQYDLGVIDDMQMKSMILEHGTKTSSEGKSDLPVVKIEGISIPYVEIEMTQGTLCDLNNKPRSTKVLYVCFENGKQDIYSLKETSTCEYEAIVLTPVLCSNPEYRPRDTGENEINCRPVDHAPKKPKALRAMEKESLKLQHQKTLDEKPQKVYAIFRVDKDGQDGQVKIEIHPIDSSSKFSVQDAGQLLMSKETNLAKNNHIQGFFKGQNCLIGNQGWWKYEFCYGKYISQYHVNAITGTKTIVSLGTFNLEKHVDWIKKNPLKKPKPKSERKQVSHLYSDGTYCKAVKKERQTEMVLKCETNPLASPSSVSLHLIELTTCDYVLRVESPLICELLEHADDQFGLINDEILSNLSLLKTKIDVTDDDDRIANGDE